MTLQAMGEVYLPVRLYGLGTSTTGFGSTNITFDSVTDRIAYMGKSQVAETLAKFYFYLPAITTGCTLSIRVESVTNGRPSGSLIAAGAETTVVVADTDDGTWKTATIGTPPTLTVGQEFAILISYSSGTTPSMTFSTPEGNYNGDFSYFSGVLQDTGAGTWTISGLILAAIIEYGTSGVMHHMSLTPKQGNGTLTAFNNSSSPDEYAMKIVVPMKCRVSGLYVAVGNVAAGADFKISLWPETSTTDGDVLGQVLVDGDYSFSTTADVMYAVHFTPVTLTAGATYYVGVRAETANNLAIVSLGVNTGITNAIKGFPIPATCHLATRAWSAGTAGAWTNTTTSLPLMSLIIDQLDDGAGGAGGGLLTHPGMAGGMRG